MTDNERIAKRAVEIAEELRKALPPNTDFGEGWQQRYLDRQNERYEKALEMARAEAELPPGELTEDEWRAAAAEAKAERGTVASRAPDIRGLDEQDIPPPGVAPVEAPSSADLLREAMPWLEMHRDEEARDLGRRIRESLRTAPGVGSVEGGKTE